MYYILTEKITIPKPLKEGSDWSFSNVNSSQINQ
jgi:hypothetical protein